MVSCPRCGLISPDRSLRCDCGFDLTSNRQSVRLERLRQWSTRVTDRHAHSPRPISAHLVYLGIGLLELWMLLVAAGFSNGPASVAPYVALLGFVILVLVAAPLALYFERVAATVATLAVLAATVSSVLVVNLYSYSTEAILPVLMTMIPMGPVILLAGLALRGLRPSVTAPPVRHPRHVIMCAALTVLPYVVFFSIFHGIDVLRILLGPWRWTA